MTLVNLSQLSFAGNQEANSLIGKLLKSVTDMRPINNPSALITKSCENARRELNPRGYRYSGRGGY